MGEPLVTGEAASGAAKELTEMILPPGSGDRRSVEAETLNREALVPGSSPSLSWLHTLRSGLRWSRWLLEKGSGRSRSQGVLHFCGGRGRSLRCLGVAVSAGQSMASLLPGRFCRRLTGLPGKSGSSGSSEATHCEEPLLTSLLLPNKCSWSCGWNHCAAVRPDRRRRGRPPPAAP